MSVINKKLFIQKVIDTLTSEQLASLKAMLAGANKTDSFEFKVSI